MAPDNTLLGREREIAALLSLLDRAAAGSGGLAFVTGEPGIGKTRLLEEVGSRARERGFCVAWGRAWELGGAPAYWPWIEVLRALLSRPGGREGSAQICAALPELDARGTPAAPQLWDSFALCDAVSGYLAAASAREPLLIVLDDLHAADPSSLQLAELVARSLRGARLGMLASYRDLEARRSQDISSALSRLMRLGDVWLLPPLSAAEVEQLLQDETGRSDPETARMIHDASDGNPLFVRELLRLRALRESATESGVPLGVRALMRERLASLSPASVALLQAAAVVGREFALGLAAEVAGVTASALDEAAAEARAADLVKEAGPGRMRFSHALVAEALAADLPPAVRTRLHRKTAEALETQFQGSGAALVIPEIAHHWLQAGSDVADRAVHAAERAARAARERFAFADAAAGYERALGALSLTSQSDSRRRAELLIGFGEALVRDGQRSRAEDVCTAAADAAKALADGDLVARAALALGAEVTVGYVDWPLIKLLARALVELGPEASGMRARVMARLASARQPAADPSEPMQLAREAIGMARRLDEPDLLLDVLDFALGALVDFAPAAERAALNREVVRLAAAVRDRPRELRARKRLLFDCAEAADLAGYEATLDGYEALTAELDHARYRWVPLMFRAMQATWQGRFAEADELEREAFALAESVRATGVPLRAARALGRGLVKDDFAAIEQAGRALISTYPSPPSFERAFEAYIDVMRGCAVTLGSSILTSVSHHIDVFIYDIHALEVATLLCWAARERSLAELLYPLLLARAGHMFNITGIGFSVHGSIDHALMQLAHVRGDASATDTHARTALEICARMQARPLIARVQCDWACALIERADTDATAAQALLAEATSAAQSLGLSDVAARCLALQVQLTAASSEPDKSNVARYRAESVDRVMLEQEGEYWTVRGLGELCRVRDNRGMRMLAQLIEQPGEEQHALTLSGLNDAVDGGDAGEVLDRQARLAYAQRVRSLQTELEEARGWNDSARVERLELEMDALHRELSRAVGLSGRARRAGSIVERARINVRRRVMLALERITAANPTLGEHLHTSIRTGVYCAYMPGASNAAPDSAR